MLLRTCIFLLFLLLLSAAASVVDRTTSVGRTKKPPPLARAVGGSPGQKRRAAARRPPGKARGQGQGTQLRQPAGRPGRQRPARRPQRRPAKQAPAALDLRQTPTYLVCYLYPAGYQDIPPSQPFAAASNGAMYPPPYISYKISKPAKARKRAPNDSVNKIFGPQPWYSSPLYPSRLVCPLYQPVSTAVTVPPLQVSEYVNSDLDNMLVTDNPDIPFADVDPGIFYLTDDGELPLPYNNAYEPSGLEPDLTYPSGGYVTPQPFGYPPPYGF